MLGPDDKPAYGEPPASIFQRQEDIPHGKLETIEYASKTVGTTRRLKVYTPPGYEPAGSATPAEGQPKAQIPDYVRELDGKKISTPLVR